MPVTFCTPCRNKYQFIVLGSEKYNVVIIYYWTDFVANYNTTKWMVFLSAIKYY